LKTMKITIEWKTKITLKQCIYILLSIAF
jgi:hypothetical protein